MTKKILSAVIFILILIVGGLWWYIRSNSRPAPEDSPVASSSPIVPFPVATDRPINVISGFGSASSSFAGGPSASGVEGVATYELYSRPVVGYQFITLATSSVLVLMDRDSGNLYAVGERSAGVPERVTNTTLLGVESAWWAESKDRLYTIVSSREDGFPRTIVYSIKKTEILSTLATSSSPAALTKEGALDASVIDIAPAPTGSKFLLLSKEGSGEAKVEVFDATTLKRTLLTTIPLTELSIEWVSTRTGTVSSKPSFSAPGILFTLDTNTGDLERTLYTGSNFFSLADKTLGNVLYTDGSQSKIKNAQATSTQILSLAAIPEKCVWSPVYTGMLYCAIPHDQGVFLLQRDAWLRGEYSTNDDVWWIDTRNGTADMLAGFSRALDASTLLMSPGGEILILKNRVTGGVLSIPLPQETSD